MASETLMKMIGKYNETINLLKEENKILKERNKLYLEILVQVLNEEQLEELKEKTSGGKIK